jgi:L-Ala-D/L-Glu epimerase
MHGLTLLPSSMRITRFTLYPSSIPLEEPFVISLGPLTHANNLFVRAEADSGHVGWGEASPFPTIHGETLETTLAVGALLARELIGSDPRDAESFTTQMDRAIAGNACCKSAFDLAFHDLAAQAAEEPLYRYLGGDNDKPMATDYTISLGPVETMVAKARWIQDQGFTVIKIKLGEGALDLERIRQIRAEVGPDIPLRIDANQGWTPTLAAELLRQMAPYGIQHCEAPLPRRSFLQLPQLRATSPIPLMADESCWDHHDAQQLIDLRAVDRINIKLSKSAGIHQAVKILRIAERAHMPLQVGGFLESRLGFTAAAHVALASPQVVFFDFDTPLMQTQDPINGGIRYGPGGGITMPTGDGLGASVDPDYLNTLPATEITG